MSGLAAFLRRHTLWMGFVVVLVPLVILLVVQYRSLMDLQTQSAIARQAALSNYLDAVGSEVRYFYLSSAERVLNLPASIFATGQLDRAVSWWENKPLAGARRLFLVDLTRDPMGTCLVFDRERRALAPPSVPEEALAMVIACTPWRLRAAHGEVVPASGLSVDERDPSHRMILNPIIEDDWRVVGVAGMIVDEEYFKMTLLPMAIQKAFPPTFSDATRNDLVVTVRDARRNVVMASRRTRVHGEPVTRNFPFIFTDWTLNLNSSSYTPAQWARANLALNLSLSLLAALVLVAGIAMALRAAGRTMRLSEMKADFVSNVSHELRTPVASIRVFAELLRMGRAKDPEKVKEYGEFIENESRRLSRLIDNILDFSRIDSGRKTYRFQPADLAEVVAGTLRTFDVPARNAGVEIVYQGPEGPLPRVNMDADAMGQALYNLLDNALKYSPEGRRIDVALRRERDSAVISVRDEGVGIDPAEHRKIFERFHRVGDVLVHDVKGAGLGLAIVRHTVEAHRGRVDVESAPGKGSLFSIRIPLDRAEAGEGTWPEF